MYFIVSCLQPQHLANHQNCRLYSLSDSSLWGGILFTGHSTVHNLDITTNYRHLEGERGRRMRNWKVSSTKRRHGTRYHTDGGIV
jgi:hypothetical protein